MEEDIQYTRKNDTSNENSETNNRMFIKGIIKQKKKYEELYNLVTILGIDGYEVEANILAQKKNDNDGYDLVKQLNEVIKNDTGIFDELKIKKKVAMEIKGRIKRPSFDENDITNTRNHLYQSLCNDIRNKTLTSKDLLKYLAAIKNVHFSANLKKIQSSHNIYDKNKEKIENKEKYKEYSQTEKRRTSRDTNKIKTISTNRRSISGTSRKENLTDDIKKFIKKEGNKLKTYTTSRSTKSKKTERKRSKSPSYRQKTETSTSQIQAEEEKEEEWNEQENGEWDEDGNEEWIEENGEGEIEEEEEWVEEENGEEEEAEGEGEGEGEWVDEDNKEWEGEWIEAENGEWVEEGNGEWSEAENGEWVKEENREREGEWNEKENGEGEGEYEHNWQNGQCEPNQMLEEYTDSKGNVVYMLLDKSRSTNSTINIIRGRSSQKQKSGLSSSNSVKMYYDKNAKYISGKTAENYRKQLKHMILEYNKMNRKSLDTNTPFPFSKQNLNIMKDLNKQKQGLLKAPSTRTNSAKESSPSKWKIFPYSKQMDQFKYKKAPQQDSFIINGNLYKLQQYKENKASDKRDSTFQVANEQWQSEKMAKEKMSKEKISSEKLSKEKISSEKLSKEKISSDKLSKEEIKKDSKYSEHPFLKIPHPSRNTKWSPIVKKTSIYKAKPKMYPPDERTPSHLNSQKMKTLIGKYYNNLNKMENTDSSAPMTKSKTGSLTSRSYLYKTNPYDVSSRGFSEVSRTNAGIPDDYVVKETDSENNIFQYNSDMSLNNLMTQEERFYHNNIRNMYMANKELWEKNKMLKSYIEKTQKNANARSKSRSEDKLFISSATPMANVDADVESNNNTYKHNIVSPMYRTEDFFVSSSDKSQVPNFKNYSFDVLKHKQNEGSNATQISKMPKTTSTENDTSNSELKLQKKRTSEMLLMKQKHLGELSDKSSKKTEKMSNRSFSKKMLIKHPHTNQHIFSDIYNTADDTKTNTLTSYPDLHQMTNKSNLQKKETKEMIKRKNSLSFLQSYGKTSAINSYDNSSATGMAPIPKKSSSKISHSQQHNKISLFNTTTESVSASVKNDEPMKESHIKRRLSYGVVSHDKTVSRNLSIHSEKNMKQKDGKLSKHKTHVLSKQKKDEEEEKLKIGKKKKETKDMMLKSKSSSKSRGTSDTKKSKETSDGIFKSENSFISKKSKEQYERTMSKEKPYLKKQLQKSFSITNKDVAFKPYKSAFFIRKKEDELAEIDNYRKSKSLFNMKPWRTFSGLQSEYNNMLHKLNSEQDNERRHRSVTENTDKTMKSNENIHDKNTNESGSTSAKTTQSDETENTQDDREHTGKYSGIEKKRNTTDTRHRKRTVSYMSEATTSGDTQKNVLKKESKKAKKKGINSKGKKSLTKRKIKKKDDSALLETADGSVKKEKKKKILDKDTTPQSKKKSGNTKEKHTKETDKPGSKKENKKRSNKKKSSVSVKKTIKTPTKNSKLLTSSDLSDGEKSDETKKRIQKGTSKKSNSSKKKKKNVKSSSSQKELSVNSKSKKTKKQSDGVKQIRNTKEQVLKRTQSSKEQISQSETKTETSTDVDNPQEIQKKKSNIQERNHIRHFSTLSDKYQSKNSIEEQAHKNDSNKDSESFLKNKSHSKSGSKTFKTSNSKSYRKSSSGASKNSDMKTYTTLRSKSYATSRSKSSSSVDSKLQGILNKEETNVKEKHTVKTNKSFNLKKGGDANATYVAKPSSDSSDTSEDRQMNKRQSSKIKWNESSINSEIERKEENKKMGSNILPFKLSVVPKKMASIKNSHSKLGNIPLPDGDQETNKIKFIIKSVKGNSRSLNTQDSTEIKKKQWTMKDIATFKNKFNLTKNGSSEVSSLQEKNKDVTSSLRKEQSTYSVEHVPKSLKPALKLSPTTDISVNDETKYSSKRSTDSKDMFKLNKIKSGSLETPKSVPNQVEKSSDKYSGEINVGNVTQMVTSKSKASTELDTNEKSMTQKHRVPPNAKINLIKHIIKKAISSAEFKENREQMKKDEKTSSKFSLDLKNERNTNDNVDDNGNNNANDSDSDNANDNDSDNNDDNDADDEEEEEEEEEEKHEKQKIVKKKSTESFLPKSFLMKSKSKSIERSSLQALSQKYSFKNSMDKVNGEDKEPPEKESMSKIIGKQKPILGLAFQNKLSPIKMKPTMPSLISKKSSFKMTPSFNKNILKKTSMEEDTKNIKKKLSKSLSQEKKNKEEAKEEDKEADKTEEEKEGNDDDKIKQEKNKEQGSEAEESTE